MAAAANASQTMLFRHYETFSCNACGNADRNEEGLRLGATHVNNVACGVFCEDCIMPWLGSMRTCPKCGVEIAELKNELDARDSREFLDELLRENEETQREFFKNVLQRVFSEKLAESNEQDSDKIHVSERLWTLIRFNPTIEGLKEMASCNIITNTSSESYKHYE